jgi:tetratricopeptide (TPR) repeat protein
VEDWSGHALTLALIGTYLQKPEFGGHIKEIENLPDLTDRGAFAEYQNNRLYRLLNGYDRFLDDTEKDFLQIFSLFRLPVPESALLSDVFNANEALARKLVNYRILRYNSERKEYTIHPLISAYYQTELKSHPEKWQATHREIARYYISLHRSESKNLTPLERLKPWIEAIHHFCQAEDFDSAFRVLEKNNFYKGPKNKPQSILIFELGAYETALSLLQEFFVNGNISTEPLIPNAPKKRFILREVSSCLTNLGRMSEVPAIMKLHNELAAQSKAQHDLSEGYCSLARLSVYLGKLVDAVRYANLAIRAVKKVENNKYRQNAQAYKALALSLMNGEEVETAYQEIAPSSTGEDSDDLDFKFIKDYGFYYVDFLRRNRGDLQAAQSVGEKSIKEAEKSENKSRSHRAAGEVYDALGEVDTALEHFNQAIELARDITHWPASITALSARGRFLVRHRRDLEAGRNNLEEALEYSQNGGYRVYETDTRIGLAWLHLAEENQADAREEAKQAKMMSEEMKYFWGVKDAEEVLTDLL